jgi:AmmeMemoRadiSam system protein B/AmmeMemoRadiSam system protein A
MAMFRQSDRKKIRPPRVAGQFYPGNPVELTKDIARFFSKVEKQDIAGQIRALICPHAGYMYSGLVAAHAYKLIEGKSYDTVVVISPSHTVFFRGVSVYDGGAYRTPLGDIPVDIDFVGKLTAFDPRLALSEDGHNGRAGRHEHALEVQLPFLQVVLGDFMLVPVVMGDKEYDTCRMLGEALGGIAKPGKTLIVASSDLSHFHSYQEAQELDRHAADAIKAFSPTKLLRLIDSGECEACGAGPIAAAMIAAEKMGGTEATILFTANSGDVEPDFSGRVVGYLAAVLHTGSSAPESEKVYDLEESGRPSAAGKGEGEKYTEEEKLFLKRVAVKSIENAVKGARFPDLQPPTKRLSEKRGVFVTLKKGGELRGCIGYIQALKPLVDAVREMARAAAVDDSRFLPVTPDEIEELDVEITVLSPLIRVHNTDDILIGRDGLLIKHGFQSGVLLPQVAIEHDWDRTTFLAETCLKAGLPPETWKAESSEIYRFSAVIF